MEWNFCRWCAFFFFFSSSFGGEREGEETWIAGGNLRSEVLFASLMSLQGGCGGEEMWKRARRKL